MIIQTFPIGFPGSLSNQQLGWVLCLFIRMSKVVSKIGCSTFDGMRRCKPVFSPLRFLIKYSLVSLMNIRIYFAPQDTKPLSYLAVEIL